MAHAWRDGRPAAWYTSTIEPKDSGQTQCATTTQGILDFGIWISVVEARARTSQAECCLYISHLLGAPLFVSVVPTRHRWLQPALPLCIINSSGTVSSNPKISNRVYVRYGEELDPTQIRRSCGLGVRAENRTGSDSETYTVGKITTRNSKEKSEQAHTVITTVNRTSNIHEKISV